ncbi:hypothetical protein A1O7_09106 [Cladophialophora yegresii CBS 114405]|uniref:Cytochrome P450 oxidoreductase n=1 Tax=Cladophialophora yegresii CBS 114405 TaxID=1182544 RepID=W9VT16_9EURO|nr:uncharacterized protein A1O7_09106 [Cladophialophora yegresii CBS 114405]EXJ56175.1 hypothetical protein A1O7_09106 [Cladophialophora yegresii CBS 114405]
MISGLLLLTALFLFSLLALRLLVNYFAAGLQSIPGPVLARFSDLWRFVDACKGHHQQTMSQLHSEYGPVVRVGPKIVSVADPAAVELILGLKANLDKTDSVNPMINAHEGEYLPMLISAKNSKLHARLKRPIAGAYSMSTLLSFENVVNDCSDKLMRRLREEFVDGRGHGRVCPLHEWLHFFTFDFIGRATFGKEFGFMDAGTDINNMIGTLDLQFLYIGTVGSMPWIDRLFLKNPLLLALIKTPNHLVDFTAQRIRHRLEGREKADTGGYDFLSRFLDAQKQHPEVVTDIQLAAYTNTNILAASDTTSTALTAIIMCILQYHDVYEKLQAEIDASNISFPVSYTAAQALPYLDAVIKETLRFFPTTGIDLERTVGASGLVLPTGQSLPPGTIVSMNPWPLHRDRSIFGDDADKFVPERWLRRETESKTAHDERVRNMQRVFLTFGYGPRACLGKHIAYLEIYKLIPILVGNFDLSLAHPDRPLKTWTGVAVKILNLDVHIRERHRDG